jgi:hypothetical protein
MQQCTDILEQKWPVRIPFLKKWSVDSDRWMITTIRPKFRIFLLPVRYLKPKDKIRVFKITILLGVLCKWGFSSHSQGRV